MRPLTQPMKILLARMRESGRCLVMRKDQRWQIDAPEPAPYHASWRGDTVASLEDRGMIKVSDYRDPFGAKRIWEPDGHCSTVARLVKE